jgi:ATP-dependent RNA helicase SUPV3L1/SUV3
MQPVSFRNFMMSEVEPKSVEQAPSTEETWVRRDFSSVRAFQVVGAEDRAAAQKAGADETWRDALRGELAARAERFHQAVDTAIVLSNDGIIRWLGDPVARLTPGPSVLTPGNIVLADEALPAASQEIVKNRIDLWLASMMRRVLGPLFALEALQEGPEVVRELAGKLSRSLGILEREPIRKQVNALTQNERAELRKLGVRFGAYYVFVPALVKPAARTLALQLWSLQAPGDPDALMRSLGQLASSGRTSLPLDGGISRESYRVAGYRPSGERIVRVDVVERLSGIIRAAIVESAQRVAPAHPSHRPPNGFVVSGQMTSLTGCSGGQFASILRSMGFQSVQMSRTDFFGSPSAIESPQTGEPLALAPHDQAAPLVACEKEASTNLDLASPGTSAAADGALADRPPREAPTGAPCCDASAADQAAALVACEKEASTNLDLASPGTSPTDRARADSPPLDAPAVASCSDASAASPDAESTSSETSRAGGGAKDADLIDVWRLEKSARSRRAAGRKTQFNRSGLPSGERSSIGTQGPPGDVGVKPSVSERARNKKHSEPSSTLTLADAREAATPPPAPPRADRSDDVPSNEKHRQTAVNRDIPRSRSASGQQPRVKVDPDSPFAKLLELRPLLVGQAKKRP